MNLPWFLKLTLGTGGFGLWIPMVLIYVVLVVVTLLLLPFIILLGLILLPFRTFRAAIFIPYYFWVLVFNLRGLRVHVVDGDREILANFI